VVGVAFDVPGGCQDIVESGQAECAHSSQSSE
jgi:hypothetical protein